MAKEFRSGDILTAADMNNIVTDLETSKTDINDLKGDLDELDNKFTVGENLINADELSPLGEWCNYTNGIIESNSYVTNYKHTPFIKVEPNTYYSRRYNTGTASVVFFDNDKNFISGIKADIFETPTNCEYLIMNIRNDIEQDEATVLEKGNKFINYKAK